MVADRLIPNQPNLEGTAVPRIPYARVRRAMYLTFQTAEVASPRGLFARILERIRWFGAPPPLADNG